MDRDQPEIVSSSLQLAPNVHVIERVDGDTCLYNSVTLDAICLGPTELPSLLNQDVSGDPREEQLVQRNIAASPAAEDLIAARRRAAHNPRPASLRSYRLVMVEGCNYACKYCFEGDILANNRFMKPETLRRVLDEIGRINFQQAVSIHWFGGEPLMRWKQINEGLDYIGNLVAKGTLKAVSHGLTTHGGLVTPDIARRLKEHQFDVFVSIDGRREINDINRLDKQGRSTYEAAVRGYQNLRDAGVHVGFLLTPSETTLPQLFESVQFLVEDLGATRIGVNNPQPVSEGWEVDGQLLAEQLFQITEYCDQNQVDLVSPGNRILRALALKEPQVQDCRSPDGSMAATIDTEGKLSYCIVSWSDPSLHGRMKPLSAQGVPGALQWKSESHLQKACEGCIAEMTCGGPCALEAHLSGMNHDRCDFFQEFTRRALGAYPAEPVGARRRRTLLPITPK